MASKKKKSAAKKLPRRKAPAKKVAKKKPAPRPSTKKKAAKKKAPPARNKKVAKKAAPVARKKKPARKPVKRPMERETAPFLTPPSSRALSQDITPVTPAATHVVDSVTLRLTGALLPFDYQPSGDELSGVRPAVKKLSETIINGLSIEGHDVERVLSELQTEGTVSPMELWLLWRGFMANLEQFTLDAARGLRRFLARHGISNHA